MESGGTSREACAKKMSADNETGARDFGGLTLSWRLIPNSDIGELTKINFDSFSARAFLEMAGEPLMHP